MAKVVTITNPVTGQPAQVDQLDHTAQQIDDAVAAARWSHRNLLDNAYFANPDAIIDQRGGYVVPPGVDYFDINWSANIGKTDKYYTVVRWKQYQNLDAIINVGGTEYVVPGRTAVRGYVGAGYGIDRWMTIHPKSVVLISDDGCITFYGNENYVNFKQKIGSIKSFAGKTMTLSVLRRETNADTIVGFLYDGGFSQCGFSTSELVSHTFTVPEGKSGNLDVFVQHIGSDNIDNPHNLIAAKLELGTTQTLAHQDENGNWVLNDPPPDKGMELLKCIQSTADPGDGYANKVVLHTGNKPSGSYTGNGSETTRTINIGGIGSCVVIWSSWGSAILTGCNGIAFSGASIVTLLTSQAKFENGVITLATTDNRVNSNGVTYNYQVL